MATILIGIADPHWADKRPGSRRDDFRATQQRKMADVVKLGARLNIDGQAQEAQGICVAGDLFHQNEGQRIDRRLDTQLAKTLNDSLCPWFAIPGNHDMKNNRLDSLSSHPMGTLAAAGLLTITLWPDYEIVRGPNEGDPPVIITGREYTTEGPGRWLEHMASTGDLRKLKEEIGAQVLLMTHNFWGLQASVIMGEPVLAHNSIREIGADICLFGHPHVFDGEVIVQDSGGQISIVGPGALLRGTLAEHDINRVPKIVVMIFKADGTHEVIFTSIPHEPAEKVFDLESHERQKTQKRVEERFIKELQSLETRSVKMEDVIVAAEEKTPAAVIQKARSFLTQAETEIK